MLFSTTTMIPAFFVVFALFIAPSCPQPTLTNEPSIPLFIQEQYLQLSTACKEQLPKSERIACQMIYVVSSKGCLLSAHTGSSTKVSCTFVIDSFKIEQVYIVWTKVFDSIKGKTISSLSESLSPVYEDDKFNVFKTKIPTVERGQPFYANFTLDSPKTEDGPIFSFENSPFMFFFPQVKLFLFDSSSPPKHVTNERRDAAVVQGHAGKQPSCKRTPLTIPVRWLLTKDLSARASAVSPEEIDIGTCRGLATKIGFDSCTLGHKDWNRAYDLFRIHLRQHLQSDPNHKVVRSKHHLLGEPACVPFKVSDFTFLTIEEFADNMARYRIVEIRRLLVDKCSCF